MLLSLSCQSVIKTLAKPLLAFAGVLAGTVFFGQTCQGDPIASPLFPPPTDWVSGPTTAKLGTIAQLKVPADFKFADTQSARVLLERMKNPVPGNLVGILAPASGGWWIVFQYNPLGYVKDSGQQALDAGAILKALEQRLGRQNTDRARQGLPPIASVSWEVQPVHDASLHALEWAVRAESQPEGALNHTIRLLGRHGVLDAITIRPLQNASALAPLKELVKGVSFKDGERYADYREGDKVSSLALAALVTGEDASTQTAEADTNPKAAKGPLLSWALWIGLGLVGCGAVALLIRGLRQPGQPPSRRAAQTTYSVPAEDAPVSSPSATPAMQKTETVPAGPEVRPVVGGKPALQPALAGLKAKTTSFGKPGVTGYRRGAHRRRVFDYNRYFADLMSSVSGHGGLAEGSPNNGYGAEMERPAAPAPAEGQPTGKAAVVDTNSDLIANQTTLIEEQRRLIQEQSKLIEEKSKLISEKNQLLRLQSELYDQKML
jgi:hypothetical protein